MLVSDLFRFENPTFSLTASFFSAETQPKTTYNLTTQIGREIFLYPLTRFLKIRMLQILLLKVYNLFPNSDSYVNGSLASSINASGAIYILSQEVSVLKSFVCTMCQVPKFRFFQQMLSSLIRADVQNEKSM